MRGVALITGGTRGIGLGIAKRLALEGIDLALNGVRPESDVEAVLDELRKSGVRVEYLSGKSRSGVYPRGSKGEVWNAQFSHQQRWRGTQGEGRCIGSG
jgi:NAD(P)-dependent dehydrogenase (short-subunit alcohol dehydrogenase family)